jgi:glucosamine--fructose-6-phosphate aminotransferase (isomerizing)
MCGIVGYIGYRSAPELLIDGLHRLEYRGYDSAGVAVMDNGDIAIRKKAGRVGQLAQLVERKPLVGNLGIGHTRWATHGETSDINSHPHLGGNGEVALVHNGVIENYSSLRDQLQQLGYVFRSQTDTEVIAHLLAHNLAEQVNLGADPSEPKTCTRALKLTINKHTGTSGGAVLFRDCPPPLFAARAGRPLVVGCSKISLSM